MAKAARKKNPAVAMIEFSRTRDIPFNRIRLSDSNVREIDVEDGLRIGTEAGVHLRPVARGLHGVTSRNQRSRSG